MWATPGVSLSCWMFVCWRVCVLSVESRPYWRGLQRFFRTLSEQREGAERQRTTPLEHRADRGSDSTFQMADIARRILARGSTSPPVCETADCFLFLSLSLSLSSSLLPLSPPASVSLLKFQTEKHSFPHRWAAWLILSFFLCFLIFSSSGRHIYFLSPFLLLMSPSLNFPSSLAQSFPFSKKAASIWL